MGQQSSEKNNFLVNQDHAELVSELSNEDAGELFKAIFHYHETGEQLQLSPVARMVFIVMRNYMDWDTQNWKEKVERRSAAGKKGMSVRWEKGNNTDNAVKDDCAKPDNERENITSDNNVMNVIADDNNAKNAITKITESVSVSVSVSGKEKEIKDLPPKSAATAEPSLPIEPEKQAQAREPRGYTPEFEAFWKIYPQRNGKKGSKDGAFTNWSRLLQGKRNLYGAAPPTAEQLTHSARKYAEHCDRTTQYPQDAQTWLGQSNSWKEFLPEAGLQNSPPGFDLHEYCKNPDGSIDAKKLVRTQRALEGDPSYAEFLPTAAS